MGDRVYLDWNATAPLRPEARTAMGAAMDVLGNPSSVHAEGRAAKAIVENARADVARLVGVSPEDVVFTSGATEAMALVMNDLDEVLCAPIEHDCVWAHLRSAEKEQEMCDLFAVDAQGQVSLHGSIPSGQGRRVFALQAANSETGILQRNMPDLPDDVLVLRDAVQLAPRSRLDGVPSRANLQLLSAHKLGGPKGVGALIADHKARARLTEWAVIVGGGQERGLRAGTENVLGIAGFGAACAATARDLADGVWGRVKKLRNILENTLADQAKDTIFVGQSAERLPNTTCMVTPGWKGETQVMQMDLAGFAVSSGAACSSGKVRASRVLKAMGFDDVAAASALRVSMGPSTTEDEVMRFAEAWLAQEQKFRQKAA